MNMRGKLTWTAAGEGAYPVVAVIPTPPHVHARKLLVPGLSPVQAEPWKVAGGLIHSYRIAGIANGATESEVVLTNDAAEKAKPCELHPDMALLLKQSDALRVSMTDVRGDVYEAPLLTCGTDLSWREAEASARYGCGLRGNGGRLRTNFVAQTTAWAGLPYVWVDLLHHNADWAAVYGDVYHHGVELQAPDGFVAQSVSLLDAPDDLDILPMHGARLSRWVVKRIGQESLHPVQGQLEVNVDGLSWANPVCAGYLPQGLPVEANAQFAADWSAHIDYCTVSGFPFDWMSLPSQNGYHVEGSPYGGAGSSYGVERFGEIGLALHGYGRELRAWEEATVNRHHGFLVDEFGHGIEADDYAENDRLPWRFSLNPNPRNTYEGQAGPVNLWKGGKDPFGFTTAQRADEEYAAANGLTVPHKEKLYQYAPYDLQHGMRILRATLPLAYICGDRFSVHLLRLHACNARAEFWEGEGDGAYDNRVGYHWSLTQQDPGKGVFLGREDCWAIQMVLAARELTRGMWGRQFDRWLGRYAQTLRLAQWEYEAAEGGWLPGLIQRIDWSKELDYVDGQFAQNQGYQESMLAFAAFGLARHFAMDQSATTANQARAMRLLHGPDPLYKISVQHKLTGEMLTSKAQQAAKPFPTADYSQGDFVPAFGAMAAVQEWEHSGKRREHMKWASDYLKLANPSALADWAPPSPSMERQAACVRPVATWLHKHGMLF